MSARYDVSSLLGVTAIAVGNSEVPLPLVDMQFIISGETDQNAALKSVTGLFPGVAKWEGWLTEHDLLGAAVHVKGHDGRFKVTVSGTADGLSAALLKELTGAAPQAAAVTA